MAARLVFLRRRPAVAARATRGPAGSLRIGVRAFAPPAIAAAARRSAMGTHLVSAAMALPRLLLAIAAVAPAHLLVHSVLRSGDALQVACQLVPSFLQLGRTAAVLFDHFGRRAREE